jgi:chromosome segregation ATPase
MLRKTPRKRRPYKISGPPARNKAIKAIDDKEKNLATAATAMNKAKSDFQAAEDIIDKITDDAKKDAEKINQKYEAKKTALTKAKGKLTTAKKQMGKAERELVRYDDTLLRLEIEGLQKDIVYLQAFEKARLGLKMPKAE